MRQAQSEEIANLIDEALQAKDAEAKLAIIRHNVERLCKEFPSYF